jgi:uncharacterized HhH-GPD family protein
VARPAAIPWTGREEADRLLADDPFALLVGFVLDQQVTVQHAFTGPYVLRERLGHLAAAEIASMNPAEFQEVVSERPALHRFPGAMARRIQALAGVVHERYDGEAARIWEEAADGADLLRRLRDLPGFGPLKAGSLATLLHRRYDLGSGRAERAPADEPNLGQVDSAEALAAYQAEKRAHKRAAREARATGA